MQYHTPHHQPASSGQVPCEQVCPKQQVVSTLARGRVIERGLHTEYQRTIGCLAAVPNERTQDLVAPGEHPLANKHSTELCIYQANSRRTSRGCLSPGSACTGPQRFPCDIVGINQYKNLAIRLTRAATPGTLQCAG